MNRIKSVLSRSATIRSLYGTCFDHYVNTFRGYHIWKNDRRYSHLYGFTDDAATPQLHTEGLPANVDLEPHPDASNPVLTKEDVDDTVAGFVADPFLIYESGRYHMFLEVKDVTGKVSIAHAYSDNGYEYEYNGIVIDPNHAQHTYPNVFRIGDDWIMVPSPGSNINGEMRIYKAADFPTKWRLVSTPITEGVRQDPTPIYRDGTWYLIYQDIDSLDIVLRYTDSLTSSTWEYHPESPIFENDRQELESCSIGRAEMVPSGRPIYGDGSVDVFYRSHLLREVYHYRISELTRDSFAQEKVTDDPIFSDRDRQVWNDRFMHTVNPVYPWADSRNIVAVDGLESEEYTYSIGIYRLDLSE